MAPHYEALACAAPPTNLWFGSWAWLGISYVAVAVCVCVCVAHKEGRRLGLAACNVVAAAAASAAAAAASSLSFIAYYRSPPRWVTS